MAEFGCCFCAGAIRDENAPEIVEIAVTWNRPLDAEADLAGLLPEGIASLTWWAHEDCWRQALHSDFQRGRRFCSDKCRGAAVHSPAAAASPHERTTGTASTSGAGSRRGSGTVGLRVKDPADVPLENAICSIFAHNRRLCDTPARLRRDLLGPDLGDVAEDLTPAHSRAHSGGTDRFASAPRNGARYRHHRTQRAALR